MTAHSCIPSRCALIERTYTEAGDMAMGEGGNFKPV